MRLGDHGINRRNLRQGGGREARPERFSSGRSPALQDVDATAGSGACGAKAVTTLSDQLVHPRRRAPAARPRPRDVRPTPMAARFRRNCGCGSRWAATLCGRPDRAKSREGGSAVPGRSSWLRRLRPEPG